MIVHSCCCIGIFVWSGLIQIQKRNLESIWNSLEKMEKEKGNVFLFILGFWPIGPAASYFLPRLLLVSRSAFLSIWPACAACFPAPLSWAEPAAGPSLCARSRVLLSSLLFIDIAGPRVRAASLLKPSATTPSKYITDRIPPLHIAPQIAVTIIPRRLHPRRSPSHLSFQAVVRSRTILGFTFALGELAMSCSPSLYLLFVEWCPETPFHRTPVSSGRVRPWCRRRATVDGRWGSPLLTGLDLGRPNRIQRSKIEDTVSAVSFC
jgi:hypothetical protein